MVAIISCCLVCAVCIAAVFWFFDHTIAPRLFNSRIERLHETGLPKAFVERRGIGFRMKADDFHLPLPPGLHAMPPVITSGGFDTVDGTVEARFDGTNHVRPDEFEHWVSGRLQTGASVTAEPVPGGLLIKFHYFGDR
jgi:hypothetical protein